MKKLKKIFSIFLISLMAVSVVATIGSKSIEAEQQPVNISNKSPEGYYIDDAIFEIHEVDENGQIKSEVVDKWATTEAAHTVNLDTTKKYAIVQTKAGHNNYAGEYMINQQPIYLTYNDTTKLWGENIDHSVIFETNNITVVGEPNIETLISFNKLSGDDFKPLKGAIIRVVDDKTGAVIASLDGEYDDCILTNGQILNGEFTIYEDKAPDGYKAVDPIKCKVVDGAISVLYKGNWVSLEAYSNAVAPQYDDVNVNARRYFVPQGTKKVYNIPIVDEPLPLTNSDKLYLSKVDIDTNRGLEGAYIDICKKEDDGSITRLDNIRTNGSKQEINIPNDGNEYILEETRAPEGYDIAKEIKVKRNPDNKVYADYGNGYEEVTNGIITMKDPKVDAVPIYVNKIDGTTGEKIPGATLMIRKDNNVMYQWKSEKDKSAKLNLSKNQEYTIDEISAPEGYMYNEYDSSISFMVNDQGHVEYYDDEKGDYVDTGSNVVNFKNYKAGSLIDKGYLYKIDAKSKSPIEDGYELVLYDSDNNKIKSFTNSRNSTLDIDQMVEGKEYKVVEEKVPTGYKKAPDTIIRKKDGKLQYKQKDGSWIDAYEYNLKSIAQMDEESISKENLDMIKSKLSNSIYVEDEPQAVVYLSKKDKDTKEFIFGANLSVKEADTGNILKNWYIYYEGGSKNNTTKLGVIPNKEYIYQEEAAPHGYKIAEPIYFKVDENGILWVKDSNGKYQKQSSNDLVMYDEKDETASTPTHDPKDIKFEKRDADTHELLPGARLEVIEDGGYYSDLRWETTSEQSSYYVSYTKLKANYEYLYRESKAPQNYEQAEPIHFKVDYDGNLYVKDSSGNFVKQDDRTIIMYDKKKADSPDKTPITIEKRDRRTKALLKGARFELYYCDENLNDQYPMIDEFTINEKINMNLFKQGYYHIREIIAPNGYKMGADVYFKVDDKGNVQLLNKYASLQQHKPVFDNTNTNVVTIYNDKYSHQLNLYKVDKDSHQRLKGSKLQIVDTSNNKVLDSWTSDSLGHSFKFEYEENKVYEVQEITAPDGYKKTSNLKFRISTDDVDPDEAYGVVEIQNSNGVWVPAKEYFVQKGLTPSSELSCLPEPQRNREVIHSNGYCNKNSTELFIEDEKIKQVDVNINKKDDAGKFVNGAELTLQYGSSKDVWTTKGATDKKGIYVDTEYTLTETKTPSGYESIKPIVFKVNDKDQLFIKDDKGNWIQQGSLTINAIDKKLKQEVLISKVDAKTGLPLYGADLKIVDKNNKIVDIWKTDKVAHKTMLNYEEEYRLVENDAPFGYKKAADIIFKVGKDGKTYIKENGTWKTTNSNKIVMKDEKKSLIPIKPDIPKFPDLPKLPHIDIPNIDIPNIDLPNINLDLNLDWAFDLFSGIDFSAFESLFSALSGLSLFGNHSISANLNIVSTGDDSNNVMYLQLLSLSLLGLVVCNRKKHA